MKLPAGTITISGHVGQSRNVEPGLSPALSETEIVVKVQQIAPVQKTVAIQGDESGFIIRGT